MKIPSKEEIFEKAEESFKRHAPDRKARVEGYAAGYTQAFTDMKQEREELEEMCKNVIADAKQVKKEKDDMAAHIIKMQQPVDVEAITGAFMIWYLKQSEYPSPKDVINFFLPYLQQPAPQSDAVDVKKIISEMAAQKKEKGIIADGWDESNKYCAQHDVLVELLEFLNQKQK